MGTDKKQIAMVVKGWPRLSESFIAQEVLALEQRGFEILLYSLRHPTDKTVSAFHQDIKAVPTYLPEYLYQEPARVWQAWLKAQRLPGYREAARQFRRDLARDTTPNRVRRFGQALVLASSLPPEIRQIHAHFLHTPCSVARYAAIMRGLPYSFSAHAKDIWTTPSWEKSEKIDGAAFGVTCTRKGLEDLHAHAAPGKPDSLHLMYHGIDRNRFPVSGETTTRSSGTTKILSVGRLVPKKGFDILLRAFADLPDDLDWHWTHYGAGPEASALKRMAGELGVDARLTWHGAVAQEELITAYRTHDLFVLPSRQAADQDQDGLPNVLMEAQSQGMACIASDLSGIPELIVPGETGMLVPPNDVSALSRAIQELAANEILRQRLGEAARQRIEAEFLLQNHIGTLAQLFDDALHHRVDIQDVAAE